MAEGETLLITLITGNNWLSFKEKRESLYTHISHNYSVISLYVQNLYKNLYCIWC